jgi:hypothetical protein
MISDGVRQTEQNRGLEGTRLDVARRIAEKHSFAVAQREQLRPI